MSCDPDALFQAAKSVEVIAGSEAMYRAATNRAYYACYHCCRAYNAALPLAAIKGNGVHEQLINQLTFPSSKLTANGKARATAIGKYLRLICTARVAADYTMDETFTEEQMKTSMVAASTIFLGTLVKKGLIDEFK